MTGRATWRARWRQASSVLGGNNGHPWTIWVSLTVPKYSREIILELGVEEARHLAKQLIRWANYIEQHREFRSM